MAGHRAVRLGFFFGGFVFLLCFSFAVFFIVVRESVWFFPFFCPLFFLVFFFFFVVSSDMSDGDSLLFSLVLDTQSRSLTK